MTAWLAIYNGSGRAAVQLAAKCRFLAILCALVIACLPKPLMADDLPRLVLFDIELHDASHEGQIDGVREDQSRRLQTLNLEAGKLFENTGLYQLVDISSAADEIEKLKPLRKCNGCDIDIAKRFNADYAVLGFVYKVSNLILEIHLYLRDAKTGAVVNHMHTNIRGNTDESWLRGLRWLIKNRLKPKE
ncbi:MAG: DUF3280 domain-containing protein [Hyphomicrobiales bacterium]|nr:DUF3280 domain-containing protein [Hyphomicrobiales bacterium]